MSPASCFFEDLDPGRVFRSGPRRLSRSDVELFARLSGDHTRLHCDDAYAANTPFGRVVAHGALSLAVATGLAYASGVFEGTVVAVAGMEIRFDRPVFPGDELTLQMTVRSREARPRTDRGRITLEVVLSNQTGQGVLSGAWTVLVRRRPASAG